MNRDRDRILDLLGRRGVLCVNLARAKARGYGPGSVHIIETQIELCDDELRRLGFGADTESETAP